jgi:hypothetical protein
MKIIKYEAVEEVLVIPAAEFERCSLNWQEWCNSHMFLY